MVNMSDIAKMAGVSKMTVSRVINGNTTNVSKELRERINQIIEETGYVPNAMARSLSRSSSSIISLIVQGNGESISDPYLSRLIGNLITRIQENDYYTMINTVSTYDDIAGKLAGWRSAGAIVIGAFDKYVDQILNQVTIPIVFTDTYTDLKFLNNVGIQDRKGGCLAARYFIENNHRDFAFIGYSIHSSNVVKERLLGFKETLKEHDIDLPDENILSIDSLSIDFVKWLLSRKVRPTAIMTTADDMAIMLINQISQSDMSVPEDFSVIGFDNIVPASYSCPPLTTIAQNIEDKAKNVTELLFQQINNDDLEKRSIMLDVSLIERDSVRYIQ